MESYGIAYSRHAPALTQKVNAFAIATGAHMLSNSGISEGAGFHKQLARTCLNGRESVLDAKHATIAIVR